MVLKLSLGKTWKNLFIFKVLSHELGIKSLADVKFGFLHKERLCNLKLRGRVSGFELSESRGGLSGSRSLCMLGMGLLQIDLLRQLVISRVVLFTVSSNFILWDCLLILKEQRLRLGVVYLEDGVVALLSYMDVVTLLLESPSGRKLLIVVVCSDLNLVLLQ